MKQESIPWKDWVRMKDEGYDLLYLMRNGEAKDGWEEWMEGFINTLKTSYTIYRDERLEQKKRRKKISFFLAFILTKLEKVETLLAEMNGPDEAREEIHTKLECLKDYVNHVIKINERRIDDETGESITGGTYGTETAE